MNVNVYNNKENFCNYTYYEKKIFFFHQLNSGAYAAVLY